MFPDQATQHGANVTDALRSHWHPDDTHATTHAGHPLPTLRYAAPPPREIGRVLSAFSTQKAGQIKDGRKAREYRALTLIALLIAFGTLAYTWWGVLPGTWELVLLIWATSLKIFWGIVRNTLHTTSYTGEEGVARFQYDQKKLAVTQTKVLSFAQAHYLRTSETRKCVFGRYLHTTFSYEWYTAVGEVVFKINGSYSVTAAVQEDNPIYFAQATEAAWLAYQLPLYTKRFRQGETLHFPLKGQDWVSLSWDTVEVHLGTIMETFPFAELHQVSLNEGNLTLRRREARGGVLGIGRQGVFTFPYANLANARLFLSLINHISESRQAVETDNSPLSLPDQNTKQENDAMPQMPLRR